MYGHLEESGLEKKGAYKTVKPIQEGIYENMTKNYDYTIGVRKHGVYELYEIVVKQMDAIIPRSVYALPAPPRAQAWLYY